MVISAGQATNVRARVEHWRRDREAPSSVQERIRVWRLSRTHCVQAVAKVQQVARKRGHLECVCMCADGRIC